jgi:anti-sigma regulatory factor (Ser/Thr protein kinase)
MVHDRDPSKQGEPGCRVRLAKRAASVAQARNATRSYLAQGDRGFTEIDSAVLVVSELVSNAVKHTAEPDEIVLTMDVRHGRLHVEVVDSDPRPPEAAPRRPGTRACPAESGRGLLIVDRLSDRWGWEPVGGNGKRVWCDLESPAGWRR